MSRPTPRRPASSRGSTPRPRKIAGQAAPALPDESVEEASAHVAAETDSAATDDAATDDGPGVLARPKTTRVLIIALGIIALLLAGQTVWWVRHGDESKPALNTADKAGQITVPDGRPVVADDASTADGVEAAAKAAQELVSVDYSKYDEEVARAVDLTTERYEKEYRKTIGDVREKAVALKLVVQASVVAQGVVRANRTKLQALVFLNQVVQRTRDGKPETVVTPYRVLVTMVHTDQGWLVDDLDTDLPRDKNN